MAQYAKPWPSQPRLLTLVRVDTATDTANASATANATANASATATASSTASATVSSTASASANTLDYGIYANGQPVSLWFELWLQQQFRSESIDIWSGQYYVELNLDQKRADAYYYAIPPVLAASLDL